MVAKKGSEELDRQDGHFYFQNDSINFTFYPLGIFLAPQESQGSEYDPNLYFAPLRHTKQLLLLTFCDTTAGIDKKN